MEDAGEYAPSVLNLYPLDIAENIDAGIWEGNLSVVDFDDPDGNGTYEFSLLSDPSSDNESFGITGNILRANQSFDFENETELRILVRVTDITNRFRDANFTLKIIDDDYEDYDGDGLSEKSEELAGTSDLLIDSDNDGITDSVEIAAGSNPIDPLSKPNYPPLDLNATAPLTISENRPVGTIVGEFNATDPDDNASLTYRLVSGVEASDNSLFMMDANGTLKTAVIFDYESNASTYSIRVQAKDDYNATVEDNFMVMLTDDQHEDTDGDGFTDFQEISAGTDINDINSTPGIDFGLVAWYPFDGNASDMSGNGRHGINFQASTLTRDRMGVDLKAVSFDGSEFD